MEDILEFELEPQVAGRIAAQTAKQVVIQRLREAERELVFEEFAEKQGEVYSATVQRGGGPGGVATLDLNGRATAILPPAEQAQYERYRPGMKLKVMILEVSRTPRGPEIVVTRTHPDLLRRLFEMEVPEIYNGIVEIKGISREPGSRSKVAGSARQEGIDPVGACVGLRGIRIQNIVNELQGEKIDVIQWSRDDSVYISHALSPAQPLRVDMDEIEHSAYVVVPDRLLSLAIGRDGQNARLAARLTGWKVDIKSSTEVEIERMKQQIEGEVAERAAAAPAAEDDASEGALAELAETPEALVEAAELLAEVAMPAGVENETGVSAGELDEDEAALMAELEAEEAAAVPQKDTGLSPEELLALESLDSEIESETEIVEEIIEEIIDDEDIWKIAESDGSGPQIRFAEDILGPTPRRGGGGRRRGGGDRTRSRPPRGGGGPGR